MPSLFTTCASAWIPTKTVTIVPRRRQQQQQQQRRITPSTTTTETARTSSKVCFLSAADASTTTETNAAAVGDDETQDDDEEKYEYAEYEILQETDFVGSEWLVGTNWEDARDRIDETWVRLVVTADGKNAAIWGNGASGSWNWDVASQFLSVSQESAWRGKDIWAGVVDDYYYLQGTVRGWTFWSSACVRGQWQAKRLGLNPAEQKEAGVAPWFEEKTEETTTTTTTTTTAAATEEEETEEEEVDSADEISKEKNELTTKEEADDEQ